MYLRILYFGESIAFGDAVLSRRFLEHATSLLPDRYLVSIKIAWNVSIASGDVGTRSENKAACLLEPAFDWGGVLLRYGFQREFKKNMRMILPDDL